MAKKGEKKGKVENLIPYQFQKGQSGNPNGRPKGFSFYIKELCQERLNELVEIVWIMAEDDVTDEFLASLKLSRAQKKIYNMCADVLEGHKVSLGLLDRVVGRPGTSLTLEEELENQARKSSLDELIAKLASYGYEIKEKK